jgi:kynureninase
MLFEFFHEFALRADASDSLGKFRDQFLFPMHDGSNCLYFTGNSLGLQPISAMERIRTELHDWAELGVEGHFNARNPWFSYHEQFARPLSAITGSKEKEVVAMGSLTNNLHLLLVSFYRPTASRYKILCEKKAFPSDTYALKSQIRFHGFDPTSALIEIGPREGEYLIREEDILEVIGQNKDELALVMIGGVNYFTGQLFDMEKITAAAHDAGAFCGWDLAHAIGNVELKLHEWGVDFAAWCSYKYLNSSPGGVAGLFVHEKHLGTKDIPRFEGWWGTEPTTRFLMEDTFEPMDSAGAWQLSNAPVLAMAVHKASLDLFEEAGFENLRKKSIFLTGYLEFVVDAIARKKPGSVELITPREPGRRGCQLSLVFPGKGKALFQALTDKGVVADWREPNVVRLAPVPLYNSYEDVFRFGQILDSLL